MIWVRDYLPRRPRKGLWYSELCVCHYCFVVAVCLSHNVGRLAEAVLSSYTSSSWHKHTHTHTRKHTSSTYISAISADSQHRSGRHCSAPAAEHCLCSLASPGRNSPGTYWAISGCWLQKITLHTFLIFKKLTRWEVSFEEPVRWWNIIQEVQFQTEEIWHRETSIK